MRGGSGQRGRAYLSEAAAARRELARRAAEEAEESSDGADAVGGTAAADANASRAGLGSAEYMTGAGNELPDSSGGEHVLPSASSLVDLACVIVRAYAPFRLRLSSNTRKPPQFKRARWLRVLPAEGGSPLPVLIYAQHIAAPEELEALFPDPKLDGQAETPFPIGQPLVLRNLVVADGGVAAWPAAAQASSGGAEEEELATQLVCMRSAPGTRAAIAQRGARSSIQDAELSRSKCLNDTSAMWVSEGRDIWLKALRADTDVGNPGRSPRSPAPLCELHGHMTPGLPSLTRFGSSARREQVPFAEVAALAGGLHVNELAPVLVKACVVPPGDGAGDDGEATFVATSDRGQEGGCTLRISLADVNDAQPTPAEGSADASAANTNTGGTPRLTATMYLHSGTSSGTAPTALWQALSLAASSAAGEASTTRPVKCTVRSALAAAQKLTGAHVAVALDVFKPGASAPVVEVVGLYLVNRSQAPAPAAEQAAGSSSSSREQRAPSQRSQRRRGNNSQAPPPSQPTTGEAAGEARETRGTRNDGRGRLPPALAALKDTDGFRAAAMPTGRSSGASRYVTRASRRGNK